MNNFKNKAKAEQLLPLIEQYGNNGYTIHDIAIQLNVSHYYITKVCLTFNKSLYNKLLANGIARTHEPGSAVKKVLQTTKIYTLKELIQQGFSQNQICKKYKFDAKAFKRFIIPTLDTKLVNKLKENQKNNQKYNGVRNGSLKGAPNNKHYPLIKELLYKGLSSMKIKESLERDYNIKMSHTAVIRVLKVIGTDKDISQLKVNALQIQSQACLNLVNNKTSKPEQMLRDIVLNYFPNAIWKYPVLNKKGFYWEIDIALPDCKIAIEYDCTYWHSKKRDQYRDKDLQEQGWNVLRFIYFHNPSYETLHNDFINQIDKIQNYALKKPE